MLDGSPIVGIVTGFARPSRNPKTGPMLQTWILKADVAPVAAINTGEDSSVCGDCPLRGIIDGSVNRLRSCYVQVKNAPGQVWEAWRRGNYPAAPADLPDRIAQRGLGLRLGAYGDPVAIPRAAWLPLIYAAPFHTGYTHSWRFWRFRGWRRYIMASVESFADSQLAQSRGWRTFRTQVADNAPVSGEFVCPASAEAGHRLTCATCRACMGAGAAGSLRASVLIRAHGSPAVVSSYRKRLG